MKLPGAAPGFDEPLEMLAACHERIERQLATLERLLPHLEQHGPNADAREAAAAVVRYFDTAGRHHHADEDEDLFPALEARAAREGRDDVREAIGRLGREHREMEAAYAELRGALEPLGAPEPALVARFAALYRRHMALEAERVLPFARAALDEAERAELGRRMAGRRGARIAP